MFTWWRRMTQQLQHYANIQLKPNQVLIIIRLLKKRQGAFDYSMETEIGTTSSCIGTKKEANQNCHSTKKCNALEVVVWTMLSSLTFDPRKMYKGVPELQDW